MGGWLWFLVGLEWGDDVEKNKFEYVDDAIAISNLFFILVVGCEIVSLCWYIYLETRV